LKKYVTPSIACVELRTEEKFAACTTEAVILTATPLKTRSGIAAEHLLVSVPNSSNITGNIIKCKR
jgi:hypothetical protein